MVLVNYSGKEINAKVVYYGPALCGKTTNLEFIYGRVPESNRGKMVSMKTRTERTLFFDFLPLNLGQIGGFQTRFLLYTVPGQVYYNATRKLVLKAVDAVVFVADSQRGKMNENVESLENLRQNLREHGVDPDEIPLVMQYNKRDLPDVYTVDEMQAALNPKGLPFFEAVAPTGEGVFETFKGVARLLLAHLSKRLGGQRGLTGGGAPAAAAPEGDAGASGSPPRVTVRPAAPVGGENEPETEVDLVRNEYRGGTLTPADAGITHGPDPQEWTGASKAPGAPSRRRPAIEGAADERGPAAPARAAKSVGRPPELRVISATARGQGVDDGLAGDSAVPESQRVLRIPIELRPEEVRQGIVIEIHLRLAQKDAESDRHRIG
jgi:signal recognition particle receptor subunit beta